jgi:G:T-mismatch repair DNA endonuclease (very short patch repair protein)
MSANQLIKRKYKYIGPGLGLFLSKLLKDKIKITAMDMDIHRLKQRDATCIEKHGKIYSDGYTNRIANFKKDPDFARKVSLSGWSGELGDKRRKKESDKFKSDDFKLKRIQTLIDKYGTQYVGGTSNFHKRVKSLLEKHNIITESECVVKGTGYIADEIDHTHNIVIEMNGDFWHANPTKFDSDFVNPINHMIAKDVWKYDKKRKKIIEKNGYSVFIIWESDNINEKIEEYKRIYGII